MESNNTWDLLPNVNNEAYTAWAKKAVGIVLQQPGLIEFRANRNLMGTPQVRVVSVWSALSDWAKFAEETWPPLEAELRGFATNIQAELWGPSPVVPQPLHPTAK